MLSSIRQMHFCETLLCRAASWTVDVADFDQDARKVFA